MLKKIFRFLSMWRIDRIAMLSLVTASTAYGYGATISNTVLAGFIGAFLCAAGFYLDYVGDAKKDRVSGKLSNPVSSDRMPKAVAIVFVIVCGIIAAILGIFVNPWTLIPAIAVLLMVMLENIGVMNSPVGRSFSLGFLQSMYALIGGLASGRFRSSLVWICLFLFFAMAGGRVIGDIRDLERDRATAVKSMPLKYGMRFALLFMFTFEILAYAAGFMAYFMGGLRKAWLDIIIATACAGTIINILLAVKPVPRRARILNSLSLAFLGGLYIVGMFLVRK